MRFGRCLISCFVSLVSGFELVVSDSHVFVSRYVETSGTRRRKNASPEKPRPCMDAVGAFHRNLALTLTEDREQGQASGALVA